MHILTGSLRNGNDKITGITAQIYSVQLQNVSGDNCVSEDYLYFHHYY